MKNNLFFIGDVKDDVEAAVLLQNLLGVVEQLRKQKKGNAIHQREDNTIIHTMATKSEDAILLSIKYSINTVPFIVFNKHVFLPECVKGGETVRDRLTAFMLHALGE